METTTATPKSATASLSIPMSPNTASEKIQQVYKAQLANRQALKNTSASQRKAKLKKLEQAIMQFREKIGDAIYADFKKPRPETD